MRICDAKLEASARDRRAGRLRLSRRRGHDPGGPLRPRAPGAVPRAVPRLAGACDRVGAARCSAWTMRTATEFNLFTRHPVIDLLPEQRDIADKGGTMRLGVYPCQLSPARARRRSLRRADRLRAAPPPLRVQQRVPRPARRSWLDPKRPLARRPPGRDRRARRPSVDARHPVPSRS